MTTSRRAAARAVAALVGASAVALFVAGGCEPQEIYLFDGSPTITRQSEPDAGEAPYVPSAEPDAAAPPDRWQPACQSPACEACVQRGVCNIESTFQFCHPVTGACEVLCDPRAPPQTPGSCPGTVRCDPRIAPCVGCVASTDCQAPLSVCDENRGSCVECLESTHCPTERPVCDLEASRCIECSSDSDCAATGEVCLDALKRCVQCRNDADCAARGDGSHCLFREQRCVECTTDSDCVEPGRPFCSSELECEDERE